MKSKEIIPEEPVEWLRTVGEDAEAPDKALRTILRGPEPTPDVDDPVSEDDVSGAVLDWLRTHGEASETPDEALRRLHRGPKPLGRPVEATESKRTQDS
jgi:uncharacterized protein YjeT (DUF2065 family)